jgi:hypothetical protein
MRDIGNANSSIRTAALATPLAAFWCVCVRVRACAQVRAQGTSLAHYLLLPRLLECFVQMSPRFQDLKLSILNLRLTKR